MSIDASNALVQPLEPAVEPPQRDDALAIKLRGFGPLSVLAFVAIVGLGPVFEPLGAILVLVWAHRSRTPWAELGFVRVGSWGRTVAGGILLGCVFKILMKTIVMPLAGSPPINEAYHYLAGNQAALPGMLFDVVVGAGFGEETVFRGFLFERLGMILGRTAGATMLIVLLTSTWFGLIHYPGQGFWGTEQALVTGFVFGTILR